MESENGLGLYRSGGLNYMKVLSQELNKKNIEHRLRGDGYIEFSKKQEREVDKTIAEVNDFYYGLVKIVEKKDLERNKNFLTSNNIDYEILEIEDDLMIRMIPKSRENYEEIKSALLLWSQPP